MPVVRTQIDIQDVAAILTSKGYIVNRNPRFQIQLGVKGTRQYSTGSFETELLRGISKQEAVAILERAETAQEAALLFEKLSLGQIASAVEQTQERGNMGLTAEDLEGIISRRVANEVQRAFTHMLDPVLARLAKVEEELANLPSDPEAKKKCKGKKGKGKKEDGMPTADETEAILAKMGIPTTVPDQPA